MTSFTQGNLTISSAAQGAVTIQVPNYSETFSNTQARQLANAVALTLTTPSGSGPNITVGDITIAAFPMNTQNEPWPGASFQVTGANPVFTLNMTQDQARNLATAISLYTVTG